jgi:glutamate transport system permease protein
VEDGMSASVLFDAPGPRTRRRHLVYTIATVVVLVLALAFAAYKLDQAGQFEGRLWEPLVTPRYVNALLESLLVTLQMAATAVLGALVFGVLFGIGKLSDHGWVRWPCWAVVEFFRAVPLLLMISFIFIYWFINSGDAGDYWSVVIALILYNGAVLAEVFRAGILAVPPGQAEAAYAIGMRKTQVMTTILLPQAVKIMIPAIISQCVVALKDTSLAYVTGALVLPQVGEGIFQRFQNQIPVIIALAIIYIAVNLVLTAIANWAQRRYVGERKQLEVTQLGNADQTTV